MSPWLSFLGPTLAVTITYLLNARTLRAQNRKLADVHEIVNGQNSELVMERVEAHYEAVRVAVSA